MSKDVISRLDLVFCIDLTGSMGGFITAARTHIAGILEAMHARLGEGLRVGIVGYRDHCDGKNILEIHDLTTDLKKVRATVDGLKVFGGGDGPEAVYSGLTACRTLPYVEGSYRVVILVADAPPHACGAGGDSYAQADPTGLSLDDMANDLEADGVFVHALAMNPSDRVLEKAFVRIAVGTGGCYHDASSSNAAMRVVEVMAEQFLGHLDFDRRLLELMRAGVKPAEPATPDEAVPSRVEVLAKRLTSSVGEVNGGLMRLRQRRLLVGLE